jgi:hypothetical protein
MAPRPAARPHGRLPTHIPVHTHTRTHAYPRVREHGPASPAGAAVLAGPEADREGVPAILHESREPRGSVLGLCSGRHQGHGRDPVCIAAHGIHTLDEKPGNRERLARTPRALLPLPSAIADRRPVPPRRVVAWLICDGLQRAPYTHSVILFHLFTLSFSHSYW